MKQLPLIGFDALAHEAAAVNEIKRHKRFTVVIGNPPYSATRRTKSNAIRIAIVDATRLQGARSTSENQPGYKMTTLSSSGLRRHASERIEVGVLGYITNQQLS